MYIKYIVYVSPPVYLPITLNTNSNLTLPLLLHYTSIHRSVISPVTPFSVVRIERRAMFYYDLAALLSSVLKLRGGVAMRWAGANMYF